jgi:sRNA-binding regulator protein Hfq
MGERERPGDRGRRRAGPPQRNDLRSKAQEIQTSAGIPYNMALQVARGERTLSDVLQRMVAEDRVAHLVRKHEIPRSLAAQVALGQADLEAVLLKRELDAYVTLHREKSVLAERLEDKKPVGLALHGQRTMLGIIQDVDVYEFKLLVEGTAEPILLHKLQAKYAWDPDEYKLVKKGIDASKDGRKATEPIWKPQDRYPCSDKRLFAYKKADKVVLAHLLEGEVLRGRVTWFGRWEFGLAMRAGGTATVFRHALKQLEEA